jgi:hypothetical protein
MPRHPTRCALTRHQSLLPLAAAVPEPSSMSRSCAVMAAYRNRKKATIQSVAARAPGSAGAARVASRRTRRTVSAAFQHADSRNCPTHDR